MSVICITCVEHVHYTYWLHMYYTCISTHAVHVYDIHLYYICSSTYAVHVYDIHLYYICSSTHINTCVCYIAVLHKWNAYYMCSTMYYRSMNYIGAELICSKALRWLSTSYPHIDLVPLYEIIKKKKKCMCNKPQNTTHLLHMYCIYNSKQQVRQ